ncbi:MAG: TRAP transporter small permease [Thermodesulfobacteriota bacterium]
MKRKTPASGPASRPGSNLAGLLDKLTQLSLYGSGLALLLLLAAYVHEVIVRYCFNAPTSWTYDLSTWFLGVSIMLALPEITRRHGHIAITFFLDKLPAGSRKSVSRIIFLTAFVFCLLTALICLQETARQFAQNIETFWKNPVPKWWVSSVIPLGFTLCGLQFLRFGLNPKTPEV